MVLSATVASNTSSDTADDPKRVEQQPRLDIAVVIVTCTSAPLAIEALRSVHRERAATDIGIRAIVIDNSGQDLAAIAAAAAANDWDTWVTLVKAPRNGGFAYGNNLGIAHACAAKRPDYIYLLNPDAQVREGGLVALVRFLESHPHVGIAGSSIENLDGSDWSIAFRFPSLISELTHGLDVGVVERLLRRWTVARQMSHDAQPVDWISGASMMIRSSVFSAIGGMDENYFLYFEETDFCRRAKQAGFSTWYVPESRVMHIGGQSTQVTDLTTGPKRLPSYWFDSRRRYFVVTFGTTRAMFIDLVALSAHVIGLLKRTVLGRRHRSVPYYIRDLARGSVLRPRNRHVAAPACKLQLSGLG